MCVFLCVKVAACSTAATTTTATATTNTCNILHFQYFNVQFDFLQLLPETKKNNKASETKLYNTYRLLRYYFLLYAEHAAKKKKTKTNMYNN